MISYEKQLPKLIVAASLALVGIAAYNVYRVSNTINAMYQSSKVTETQQSTNNNSDTLVERLNIEGLQ